MEVERDSKREREKKGKYQVDGGKRGEMEWGERWEYEVGGGRGGETECMGDREGEREREKKQSRDRAAKEGNRVGEGGWRDRLTVHLSASTKRRRKKK